MRADGGRGAESLRFESSKGASMEWNDAFARAGSTKVFLDSEKKFWIAVRDELSHAENRAISLGSFRRIYRDDEQLLEIDPRAGADHKVLTYLVDWNLVDSNGKTIDIGTFEAKRDAVKNLKPEAYAAIEALIDKHVEAEAKKKMTSGAPESSATSMSPGGSASVT